MPSQSASPTFWRIFFGTSCALIGALSVLLVGQGIILVPAMLGGALLGAVFGVVTGPRFPRLLLQAESSEAYEIPPPKVLRLGMLLGAAEGLLAGAVFGGSTGAFSGLALGVCYGKIFAAYSWRIRQRTSVYVLAILAGAVVGALGGLAIGLLMNLPQNGVGTTVLIIAIVASMALQPIANQRS